MAKLSGNNTIQYEITFGVKSLVLYVAVGGLSPS